MPPTGKRPRRRTTSSPTGRAPDDDVEVGATDALSLRVSVGTLVRVLFGSLGDGPTMLALERTATLRTVEGRSDVSVTAKPFGGGIQIVDPVALRTAIGDFHYDSERSRRERDFRLQIRPASWEDVKRVCRDHLRHPDGGVLDTSPDRELAEEFGDALGMSIDRTRYRLGPAGMLIEDTPSETRSVRAPGRPTVRVYYIFEAWLDASEIISSILESSRRSDGDLRTAALRQAGHGGRGRANAALTLGLEELTSAYLAMPRNQRGGPMTVRGHDLAGNVSAILDGVDAPRYERYRLPSP